MRNFYIMTIALVSNLSPCLAQDSFQQSHQDWNQARMKRQLNSELHEANSRLEEIERRDRDIDREAEKAEKAEKERLLNLPLDVDLQRLVAHMFNAYGNAGSGLNGPYLIEEYRLKMAKYQDERNKRKQEIEAASLPIKQRITQLSAKRDQYLADIMEYKARMERSVRPSKSPADDYNNAVAAFNTLPESNAVDKVLNDRISSIQQAIQEIDIAIQNERAQLLDLRQDP